MKRLALIAALLLSGLALADIAPLPPAPPAPSPAAVHPEGVEKIPTGVIQGGWGYVYACYIVAIGGTIFYALSLYLRRPPAPKGPQS